MGSDDIVQNIHLILFCIRHKDKVVAFIKKHALVASKELGDREHYHIAISLPAPIKRKAFRKILTDEIGSDLNGTTDFKTVDWKDYGKNTDLEQYICKGTSPDWEDGRPEVITNRTLHSVQDLHRKYWEHQANTKDKVKAKAKDEVKKGSKCIDDISKKYIGCEDVLQLSSILGEVCDYYGGRISDHNAFSIVQAIWYKIDRKVCTEQFTNRMLRKFSS